MSSALAFAKDFWNPLNDYAINYFLHFTCILSPVHRIQFFLRGVPFRVQENMVTLVLSDGGDNFSHDHDVISESARFRNYRYLLHFFFVQPWFIPFWLLRRSKRSFGSVKAITIVRVYSKHVFEPTISYFRGCFALFQFDNYGTKKISNA